MNLRTHTLFIGFLLLGAMSAQSAFAATCTPFTRNLKLGMKGDDVKMLQQRLNSNPLTRVTTSGVGSQGMETTYFGTKTMLAVIKFQNLYAKEVLTPAGLISGSGFVGSFSRAKLLALCAATPVASTLSPAVSNSPVSSLGNPVAPSADPVVATSLPSGASTAGLNAFLAPDDTLQLRYPSDYVVHPGDKVTIYGGGFTSENNTLRIGDNFSINALPGLPYGTMEVIIPENAPKGKFDLWVKNAKGESNKSFLIIVAPGTLPPNIVSLSPKEGKLGMTITISGSQFTATNNEIYTSVADIKGLPSADGKTLSFLFNPKINGVPEYIPPGPSRGISFPVSFRVLNANGMSNSEVFTIVY